jgi:chlorobactene glucosyltransferase
MSRLLRWRGLLPTPAPRVTVLIPAKDEGREIRGCIDSVLAQDYPALDVIAIDDRSTDDTATILDEIAERDPRLSVIHVEPGRLPAGWLGKCHALYVGTRALESEWLLFVDSDVRLAVDALSSAVSIAIERNYDAVSVLTRLECRSFLERIMLPLLAGAWAVMYTISWTNEDSRKHAAAANGQFFLVRRNAYEAAGGHESVRDQITEDVELMRRLKERQFITRFFSGAHLASTRMHATIGQMFQGWSRIYSGTSRRRPWKILWAMWFIVSAMLSTYPALAWGAYRTLSTGGSGWLLGVAATHFALMTVYLMLIYRWSGNPGRYALLAPISGSIALAILGYALRKCQTGQITWRGTEFIGSAGRRA